MRKASALMALVACLALSQVAWADRWERNRLDNSITACDGGVRGIRGKLLRPGDPVSRIREVLGKQNAPGGWKRGDRLIKVHTYGREVTKVCKYVVR